MVEYTYYQSGQWQAACTLCGQTLIVDSIAEAWKRGRTHDKVCGR